MADCPADCPCDPTAGRARVAILKLSHHVHTHAFPLATCKGPQFSSSPVKSDLYALRYGTCSAVRSHA